MSLKYVKIFGERNTGTNILSTYIKQNSSSRLCGGTFGELSKIPLSSFNHLSPIESEKFIDSFFSNLSPSSQWKHAATSFQDVEVGDFEDKLVIITLRNPISWILALYKKPYNSLADTSKMSFERFVDTPWKTLHRDLLKEDAVIPADLINLKMKNYLKFVNLLAERSYQSRLINFEDFISNPQSSWSKISSTLDRPRSNVFIINRSVKEKNKDLNYYRDYYGNERWRSEISNSVFNKLFDQIDWGIYSKLNSLSA